MNIKKRKESLNDIGISLSVRLINVSPIILESMKNVSYSTFYNNKKHVTTAHVFT